ncbi:MAG TPA: alpha-1,6-glucosidase domain-containing protein, partial [Vicinamibacteria bacterium]|nr:alpha-1,6-glucosidase domain-containing protein [Vicinamibacteria bacterium]
YKVDGFRFDLMGHHMKADMLEVRAALDALTPERDGVDGRAVFVYGEGWDFGEVQGGARGENATQRRMAGTGIATFNDRLRDAARGGSAFGPLQEQGFVTGLWDAPNAAAAGTPEEQRARLLLLADRIRVGLAGGLADFTFTGHDGRAVRGAEVDYNGSPAGYTAAPRESVNYVEAHDNETLWDAIALKAPVSLPVAERVRMQNLGMSLVALGQGVPFFHAGMELLRSKSLDRNSYDSGDWFNRLDFTYEQNNWAVGLPPWGDNRANWPLHAALLANPLLEPGPADIRRAFAHLQELLRIRRSTALFRLTHADAVARHLVFPNTGPSQEPGLIVMALRDPDGRVDRDHRVVVVLFNARGAALEWSSPDLAGLSLRLHPVQEASDDARLREATYDAGRGLFRVPGRTTAVFWSRTD